jgi:hypothetical protein
MEAATLAMSLARCRIAIGVAAVAMPGPAVRAIAVDTKAGGIAPALTRMLGGRDIALGLGTVVALDHGAPVRGWLEGSALADTVDCVASVIAREQMTPRAFRATVGLAAASALLCVVLARRLDPPPSPHPGQPEAVVTGHTPAPTPAPDE